MEDSDKYLNLDLHQAVGQCCAFCVQIIFKT